MSSVHQHFSRCTVIDCHWSASFFSEAGLLPAEQAHTQSLGHNTFARESVLVDENDIHDIRTDDDPQPEPVPNTLPFIADEVHDIVNDKVARGERKYKTKLQPHNGRDAVSDLIDELVDALFYAVQWRWERDHPRVAPAVDQDMLALDVAQLIEALRAYDLSGPLFINRHRSLIERIEDALP